MNQAQKEPEKPGKNPLIWVAIIVLGLIIYIFVGSDRGGKQTETLPLQDIETATAEPESEPEDEITRQAPPSPGVIAREYIVDLRQQGKPYPFDTLMQKAADLSSEGSLADAHLLYFFAAREGHVAAMMTMAEMTDPLRFQPQNNLLDEANAIQAYKWYSQALAQGHQPAREHLDQLHEWAKREAQNDDQTALQLLLNFN
ncbi:MAG: hypothetical protein QNJ69_12260 [Gammaproteobacteria bacterium]|nr:hypothetical protein [Gammaproteobacteria bacterium]